MTYHETIEYLYSQLPAFQLIGEKAINPKLTNTLLLCEALGNPQNEFKSIHIAGTNGKGSSSHFLASILIESGLKVGLYTSPHLKDFRERFKINGQEIEKQYVIDFVANNKALIKKIKPSFFELTVALAFKVFAENKVDIAVIEVGLGGRLDSTNIIKPLVSLITNIGFDHTNILGKTLEKIAFEKAGIIKPNTPVVISEKQPETTEVFIEKAKQCNSELFFAEEMFEISEKSTDEVSFLEFNILDRSTNEIQILNSQLIGDYQLKNIIGVAGVIKILNQNHFKINKEALKNGIANVISNTNLKGRWQVLHQNPTIICDTGHNEPGIAISIEKIKRIKADTIFFILGFVKDKDFEKIISMFPKDAIYYFCAFNSHRALTEANYEELTSKNGQKYQFFENVNLAIAHAKQKASNNDLIFIGGSTYLVAEINNL